MWGNLLTSQHVSFPEPYNVDVNCKELLKELISTKTIIHCGKIWEVQFKIMFLLNKLKNQRFKSLLIILNFLVMPITAACAVHSNFLTTRKSQGRISIKSEFEILISNFRQNIAQ